MKKNNFEKDILKHGLTEREIAEILNCSQQNVHQIIQRALRKLRVNASKFGLEELWELWE